MQYFIPQKRNPLFSKFSRSSTISEYCICIFSRSVSRNFGDVFTSESKKVRSTFPRELSGSHLFFHHSLEVKEHESMTLETQAEEPKKRLMIAWPRQRTQLVVTSNGACLSRGRAHGFRWLYTLSFIVPNLDPIGEFRVSQDRWKIVLILLRNRWIQNKSTAVLVRTPQGASMQSTLQRMLTTGLIVVFFPMPVPLRTSLILFGPAHHKKMTCGSANNSHPTPFSPSSSVCIVFFIRLTSPIAIENRYLSSRPCATP